MVRNSTYQVPLFVTDGVDHSQGTIDEYFNVEFANKLAAQESYNKHLYRPNSYLHKWWARRCGSTFRLILKHLVTDEMKRDYYSPGGLEGTVILDPMMGGGTTLHEAIRLGANIIGVDIDPIPVLQARATLSHIPLEHLEKAFEILYYELKRELGDLFLTVCPSCGNAVEFAYILYGALRRCRCSTALFVDSLILRYNNDDSKIQICEQCHNIVSDAELCNCCGADAELPIVEKGTQTCAACNSEYEDLLDVPFYRRYKPVAIIGDCPQHGQFFTRPRESDLGCIERADALRAKLNFRADDFAIEPGPKSGDLVRRGVKNYLDLFSSRQLIYLDRAISILSVFEPLLRLNLGLLVSTSLEFNSMLCGYKGGNRRRPGAVRHTFAHHAYTIPYTALENNPLFEAKASGSLQNLFHARIRRAREWALHPEERVIEDDHVKKLIALAEVDYATEVEQFDKLREGDHKFMVLQGSSASLDLEPDSIDYVVTDPPYFDSVQYGDLAAFFRVWLRKLLPGDANWEYDLSNAAVDPQANGNGQYTKVLGAIFAECHRVLKKDTGRLVFTFHHWNPKGWAALTKTLKYAGFILVNRYVVHSENPASVHIKNLKSLTHDAILVLAPIESGIANRWILPEGVDTSNSQQFCEGCATVLGWMLSERLDDAVIEKQWTVLLAE